ncbi:MAG: hypothetical protein FWD45_04555, partial [Coriobacteriia bacterium]|nr:hypothetical protein [Coriobacteriia bacterium]
MSDRREVMVDGVTRNGEPVYVIEASSEDAVDETTIIEVQPIETKTDALAVPVAQSITTALTAHDVVAQVALIQQVMEAVMKEGEHYGVIPGTSSKPTLLQPGAQKLLLTFNFAPRYEVEMRDLENSHREYEVRCILTMRQSGQFVGEGVGICSTMESKYRYRGAELEDTEADVPKEYWTARSAGDKGRMQALLGGKNRTTSKRPDGSWGIFIKGERKENPDIADTYNTVLKMSKKRALVDAVLTATAASDIFTQDLEDMGEMRQPEAVAPKPQTPPPPPRNPLLDKLREIGTGVVSTSAGTVTFADFVTAVEGEIGMALSDISTEQ